MSLPWKSQAEVEATLQSLSEESDRGFIILVVTQLEDSLARQVAEKMPGFDEQSRDRFFGPDGLGSNFAIKSALAYGLGLVSSNTYHKLELIRVMRNACAHSIRPISFDSADIKESTLELLEGIYPLPTFDPDSKFLRLVFQFTCLMIMGEVYAQESTKGFQSLMKLLENGKKGVAY